MKIKVIALLCLMAMLLTALVACGGKTDGGDKDSGKIDTSDAKKIENISEYVLVKPAGSSQRIKDASRILKEAIKNATSANLMDAVDTRKEEKYEILIGNTSRDGIDIDASKLGNGEFVIKLVGDKLFILGGSEVAVTKGVQCFIDNYINGKDGVYAPTGDGLRRTDENVYSKIEVDGKPLSGFVISGELYEIEEKHKAEGSDSVMEAERLASFAKKMEEATYASLSVVNSENLGRHEGNYIFLDDTNPDFSSYEIKLEDGNIILYANYYSLDDCINSFFADILGYDLKEEKITGEKSLNITEGKSYTVEKSEIYTKDKLYDVLEGVYNNDDTLIIGQHLNALETIGELFDYEMEQYKKGCGVEPALISWDTAQPMRYASNQKSLESARVKMAYQLTEYIRGGGIVSLMAQIPNPGDPNPPVNGKSNGQLGGESAYEELLTEGTEINERYMKHLVLVGDFLEILDKNGAPVIFRPLLESNGAWMWYGATAGNNDGPTINTEYVKRLWVYMYNYLVNERGIKNLIWEYSPNVIGTGSYNRVDVMDCYPGDEYVDMVALDWYPGQAEHDDPVKAVNDYTDLVEATGKIFAFAEFGAGDMRSIGSNDTYTAENLDYFITDITERGIKMAYLLTWSSWGSGEERVKMAMYEIGQGDDFFKYNDRYLDKSEVKALLYGE